MIYMVKCNKKELTGYLTQKINIINFDIVEDIKDIELKFNEILLVWPYKPIGKFSLPHALIVPDKDINDIYAWIFTYFRQYKPFTAHCRIMTLSVAKTVFISKSFNDESRDLCSVAIGMILAEGVAYSVGRADWNRLSFSAYTRTLSYVIAESAMKFGSKVVTNSNILDTIINNWISVKEFSNKLILNLKPINIREIWDIVLPVVNSQIKISSNQDNDYLIISALTEIKSKGNISSEIWYTLTKNYENVFSIIKLMSGPLEERVKATELSISALLNSAPQYQRVSSFIIGYLASQIKPGSLDYFPVIFPATRYFKESILWYGVCSALYNQTIVDYYGSNIGLLIRRELERDTSFLDRPNCDITYPEIELMLNSKENIMPTIQTSTNGMLRIELFPTISTNVKWPNVADENYNRKEPVQTQQPSLFNETYQLRNDVIELLRKIEDSHVALNEIRIQVEKKFGEKTQKNRGRSKM